MPVDKVARADVPQPTQPIEEMNLAVDMFHTSWSCWRSTSLERQSGNTVRPGADAPGWWLKLCWWSGSACWRR